MLVLTRKSGEAVLLGDDMEITVLEVQGDKVRLGIRAPASVSILRKEIAETAAENQNAAKVPADSLEALKSLLRRP